MEVHKHPHHVMHKKKWNEYLLEFFMLFLAVFLGFVAENVRENIIEKSKEKEFAKQLIDGLKQDTTSFRFVTQMNAAQMNDFDSILFFLSKKDDEQKWRGIYRHVGSISGMVAFRAQQASFDQIKNSGALRYFKNQEIVNKLTDYRFWIDLLEYQQNLFVTFGSSRIEPFILNNFDFNLMSQRFQSKIYDTASHENIRPTFANDPEQMRLFQNLVIEGREIFFLPKENIERTKVQVEELISILQKEYHLKNE